MARRVVTGRDASGKSVFVSDEQVPARGLSASPGAGFVDVWGSDRAYQLPSDGSPPPYSTFFPPAEGFRYMVVTFPADSTPPPADLDLEAVGREIDEKFPGLSAHMEPDAPGMHTTQTVDIGVVLSGNVSLELDDGATVDLGPGDFVVQNGTRHAWRNTSGEPCTMAFVLIGANQS